MYVVLLISGIILWVLRNGLTQYYLAHVSNAAVCYVLHSVWDRVLIIVQRDTTHIFEVK